MRARLRPQGPGGQGGKLNGVVFRKKHNRQVNREVESAMGVLKQTHWITVLAVACLAFSSCARQYRSGTAATTSSRYKSARNSAQTHSASKEKQPAYRLGYGDVLDIRFFNNNEFNITVPVRPDGRISIDRIGEIYVAGKTVAYLDDLITKAYSRILRNPDITINVTEFGSQQIFVLGEVQKPGIYPMTHDMSVIQALAVAGGHTKSAKLSSVIVVRQRPNGEPAISRLNISGAFNDPRAAADLQAQLQPMDVVWVPSTFISDLSNVMGQIYDVVLPPIDVYLRALWCRR